MRLLQREGCDRKEGGREREKGRDRRKKVWRVR